MIAKRILVMALAATLFVSCKQNPKQAEPTEQTQEEMVEKAEKIADFSMKTPEGNTISAIEEISKHEVTILDFWASWCGPCLREMPRMVELYRKYENKGLGIISISLDSDEDSWKNAIRELSMSWTNISELNGWNNSVAQAFNVNAIPYMVIVDKEGTVLQKGLIAGELSNIIESRLGK